ncbi:5031_t:CDS:10 [Ambispora gerdemannii]|uniref:5031_t:CDS:1 n=1 Tax=Ambispora gerdemannii TaxID=144530 RepID=A0A9N8ZEI6_9GLOM|nr:5031_t:CDS:10 [Ambispora gerdemannii]
MASEPKTPADYAMLILYKQFIKTADRKLNNIMSWNVDREPDFMKIVGPGADQSFDKLLNSLGYIVRHRPRSLIDTMMLWRKEKTEKSSDAPDAPTHKRKLSDGALVERVKDPQGILTERKAQLQPDALGEDRGAELETLIFDQLIKGSDPELIQRVRNREASFNLYAELIGSLSNIRFPTVSDRFIAELEKYAKFPPSVVKEHEAKITMLIKGMRYLKLKIYPEGALEETAEFLKSLAGFLKIATGTKIKHAYAELFVQLLTPIAGVALAEVNYPVWVKAVEMVYPKAWKMTEKPRHCEVAYTFATTLLCVSQRDFFAQRWWSCAEACFARFKEKDRRHMTLGCLIRLVWTFLYRCTETTGNTQKKLDTINRILFPLNKTSITPSEVCLELFVLYVYYIGFKPQHYEYCLKNLIFYLLNSEVMTNNKSVTLDNINAERMNIGIRAFGLLLAAMQNMEARPPFPTNIELVDIKSLLSGMGNTSDILPESFFTRPGLKETFTKFCEIAYTIASVVDNTHGHMLVLDERHLATRSGSISSTVGPGVVSQVSDVSVFHQYATLCVIYPRERQPYLDLLKTYVRALPRILPPNVPKSRIVDMLCRYTVHLDPDLAKVAANALGRIANQCGAEIVIIGFSRFVYRIEDKYAEILAGTGPGMGTKFGGALKLYIELLRVWLAQLRENPPSPSNNDGLESPETGEIPKNNNATHEIEDTNIGTIIEEAEANGLLFLCSQSCLIRKYAVNILMLVAELESEFEKRCARDDSNSRQGDHGQSRSHDDITLVGYEIMSPLNSDSQSGSSSKLLFSATSNDDKKPYTRIIHVLKRGGGDLIKFDKLSVNASQTALTIVEQIRLQKLLLQGKKDILLRLLESEHNADAVIWAHLFPEFMKICFECFPVTVALCRNNVCLRIIQMQNAILNANEYVSRTPTGSLSMSKFHLKPLPNDEIVSQWRSYLIVACSTITHPDDYMDRHWTSDRKRSEASHTERITSARALFRRILGFLTSEHTLIREAVVAALGNINDVVYKVLLDDLQPYIQSVNDDYRTKTTNKPYSSIHRRIKRYDRLRTEIAHVLQLTAHFLMNPNNIHNHTTIMNYVKDTYIFLRETEFPIEWEWQKLRQYFCGLVEKLYDGISQLNNIKREMEIMSFDMRIELFKMFEEWCGHGPKGQQNRDREGKIISTILETYPKDSEERRPWHAQLETERKALELAALNAMASLCRGPLFVNDNKPSSFDVQSLFKWIESVFADPQDKLHPIARKAIEGLLVSNTNSTHLLDTSIHQTYSGNPSNKLTQGYFLAIAQTLFKVSTYPLKHPHKIIALALFKVGDPDLEIRKVAIKLLKMIEKRIFDECCAAEYEVGITCQLSSIYKQAQVALSTRLAQNARKRDEMKRKRDDEKNKTEVVTPSSDPNRIEVVGNYDESHYMLSEFTFRFEAVGERGQRDMLNYFLPWLRNIELIVNDEDELPPTTNMIISNLFFITVKYGDIYVKEVELIWQQLVTGEHVPNVQAIVKFLIDVGLEKRNPNFVTHAKRVFVFLGRTPACAAVIEKLISKITPRSMTPQPREKEDTTKKGTLGLWYASFDEVLPAHNKRPVFSAGQLAMLYMVDMAIEAGPDLQMYLPLLLHVLFVQLDSVNLLISEETRSLLVNLIYSIIIGRSVYPDIVSLGSVLVVELKAKEGPQLWQYEDINYTNRSLSSFIELDRLAKDVIKVFGERDQENLQQMWGEQALSWATTCPVRHIVCRSFQIFRSLKPIFNIAMLADMLLRLGATIADTTEEIQGFALEILITLTHVVDWLEPGTKEIFPQMLWATIACLQTINEPEFLEALGILEKILKKFDMQDPENQELFWSYFPGQWQGKFEGIQPLLLKGIRSSISLQPTFNMLKKLIHLNDQFVDPSKGKLLYLILANLPRMADVLSSNTVPDDCIEWAQNLSLIAEQEERNNIVRVLGSYMKDRFRQKDDDFLKQIINVIRDNYFPEYEAQTLLFLMSLLSNKIPYYKLKTMKILKILLPFVNTQRTELYNIGAELILPLLRLLPTTYSQEAIEVLDETISITGGPKDRHIIRMSIHAKKVQKDFDTTASLFGIPDDSGWAVPDPVNVALMTRQNVQAVCLTCKVSMTPVDYEFFPEIAAEIVSKLEDLENYFNPIDDDADMMIHDGVGSSNSIRINGDSRGRSMTLPLAYQIPRIIQQDLGDDFSDQTNPEYYSQYDTIFDRHLSESPSMGSLRSYVEPYYIRTSSSSSSTHTIPSFNDNSSVVRDSDEFAARLQSISSASYTEDDNVSWYDDVESVFSESSSTFPMDSFLRHTRTPGGSFSHGTTPSV